MMTDTRYRNVEDMNVAWLTFCREYPTLAEHGDPRDVFQVGFLAGMVKGFDAASSVIISDINKAG